MELRDSAGHIRYRLTGDPYAPGRRLSLRDLADRETVRIRQVVPSLFPRCALEVYGKPAGEVVKDLSFLRPRISLEPAGWLLEGVPGLGDFSLKAGERIIGECRPDPEHPEGLVFSAPDGPEGLIALGVMLTVQCVFAPQEPRHL